MMTMMKTDDDELMTALPQTMLPLLALAVLVTAVTAAPILDTAPMTMPNINVAGVINQLTDFSACLCPRAEQYMTCARAVMHGHFRN